MKTIILLQWIKKGCIEEVEPFRNLKKLIKKHPQFNYHTIGYHLRQGKAFKDSGVKIEKREIK